MIQGMNIDTAKRYIKAIEEIEKIVDNIHAYAYLMSAFLKIDEGAIEIKPLVVGYVGRIIAHEVLRITEHLDNHFISIAEVKLELEVLKDDE